MSRKLSILTILALLIGAFGASAALTMAAAAGTGPGDALPVPAGAETLAVGQRVWYGFQYSGDKSQIVVDMKATPGGSANFAVWTQADVQNWQSTGDEKPVGRGTPNDNYGGDLVWTGNFNQAGIYYIVVDQTGGSPATITLKLTGTGVSPIAAPAAAATTATAPVSATKVVTPTVSATTAPTTTVPTTAAAAAPAATPAAAATAAATVTMAAAAGTGPGDALPVPAGAETLAVGQRVWYGFQYSGDKSQIVVDMKATPGGSANFAVWTQADVQNWQSTGDEKPVGRGTPNDNYGGDLVWTGNFNQAGIYYIVVDQTGGSPATITLKLTGTGVSPIAAPAAAATTATAPVSATKVVTPTVSATTAPTTTVPTTAAAAAPAATPAAAATAAATVTMAAAAGTGPGDALPVPAGAETLAVGQRVWYGFQYSGDKSQIVVDMKATPGGSANFAVWTQADVQNWQSTGDEKPVGRGTPNDNYGGDLVWTGNFNQAGIYYIVVDQTGGSPATITLKLTGTGVSGLGK